MNESPNPPPSRCGDQGLLLRISGSSLLGKSVTKGSLGVARGPCLDPAEGAGGRAVPSGEIDPHRDWRFLFCLVF